MAYKGNHRNTPQSAEDAKKRTDVAKDAKAAEARNRTYTVNGGTPVVPVHFTGFSRKLPKDTNGANSAN